MKIKLSRVLWASLLLAGCVDLATVGSRSVDPVSFVPERPKFEIRSPTKYVASFFAKDLRKSQFETQADYDTRIHALQPNGAKVFLQVDADLIHYVYNAEKQTLVVILPQSLNNIGIDFTSASPHLDEQRYGTSWFTIGHTSKWQFEGKKYDLNVLNFLELPLNARWRESDQSYSAGIGLAVPIPGADAEAIVGAKSVTLILGITVGDLHGAHYGERDEIYEVPVRITDIKVYNILTGYVLASWTGPGT